MLFVPNGSHYDRDMEIILQFPVKKCFFNIYFFRFLKKVYILKAFTKFVLGQRDVAGFSIIY